jgi:hypothetical protein
VIATSRSVFLPRGLRRSGAGIKCKGRAGTRGICLSVIKRELRLLPGAGLIRGQVADLPFRHEAFAERCAAVRGSDLPPFDLEAAHRGPCLDQLRASVHC